MVGADLCHNYFSISCGHATNYAGLCNDGLDKHNSRLDKALSSLVSSVEAGDRDQMVSATQAVSRVTGAF